MIYLLASPVVILSVVLLFIGGIQGKPWALYLLKISWILGLIVAAHFTLEAWKGSVHSENWAMIGVYFIVWPITGFVSLLAVAELFILKGKRDRHSRTCRVLALLIAGLLVFLSVSAVVVKA